MERSLFTIDTSDDSFVYIMLGSLEVYIWADTEQDMINACSDVERCVEEWGGSLHDQGRISSYAGSVRVDYLDQENDSTGTLLEEVYLSQTPYILALTRAWGVDNLRGTAKPPQSPLPYRTSTDEGLIPEQVQGIHQLLHAFNHLAINTRPDIAQWTLELSRHAHNPCDVHWRAAMGILSYLDQTKDMVLTYRSSGEIIGFCDTDFAGDIRSRRSTTGLVFLIGGGATHWASKLQLQTGLSTTESETYGGEAIARQAHQMMILFKSLHIGVHPIDLYIDNKAALCMIRSPMVTKQSRHIDPLHYFGRDLEQAGLVHFEYVDTGYNVADMFTKCVPSVKHNFCRLQCGLMHKPPSATSACYRIPQF
jgi:hypothetical protein